ncbi:MAG: SusD/RagB family nutrient-binding outer membrane lipoprotein [Flavobacteriaceae bacterium]|nr:SusD/RagB family nutrient-binding outer membrane lipoprotein [Flavobacteriaceae bacterium]
MKIIKNKIIIVLSLVLVLASSCRDLEELNINPNGVDPNVADLNLLLPTIITGMSQNITNLGFGDIAGVMQHTQKDGWSGSHNNYEWFVNTQPWSGYYGVLRNADEFYNKAVDGDFKFHQGVGLLMRAYTIGMITDLWGDAPFSEALLVEDDLEFSKPKFDTQEEIYAAILIDLEAANTLLSQEQSSYTNIDATQDVLFDGDVSKWRKFANSLALRYYMRLSAKQPNIAQEGINKIASNPGTYPLITSAADDATVSYIGLSERDSWDSNTIFDIDPSGEYNRTKLCATLVNAMQDLDDPRLGVWANKIEIPLVLVAGSGVDYVLNGERFISQDIADDYEATALEPVDYDLEYVGIPPSTTSPPIYNLNPNLGQGLLNPHASQLNDIYKDTNGPLLQMRMMSAAEVHFVLSEAALYGWGAGSPEAHYAAGIQESFNTWDVGGAFNDYIGGAPYTGLESIMEQKWIASWTAATEAWFDYRRTGLPDLQIGALVQRDALPIRFYYHFDQEISLNTENANAAIDRLEPTQFIGADGDNSPWSKMWLLQGTGLPY